ncbi:hypothetical protein ACFYNN_29185 [Streptomyces sp. NPDC006978]|uniref:hypothetical protein n=1 Tax=Streptomyces sp. NPDC006978 TaxID=3364769 RepID=UPI0036956176
MSHLYGPHEGASPPKPARRSGFFRVLAPAVGAALTLSAGAVGAARAQQPAAPSESSAGSAAQTLGTVQHDGKTYFKNRIPATVRPVVVTPSTPQAEIDDLLASDDPYRVIKFASGEYRLQTLKIHQGNTRIEVDPGATFVMTGTSKFVFDVGAPKGIDPIENVEIASTVPHRKFTVVVQGIPRTGDRRVARLANVTNFAVSGIDIQGSYQAQPYIVLTNAAGNAAPVIDGNSDPSDGLPPGKDYNPLFGTVPSGGVIEDVSANRIHSGYATVQTFGANNVYMKDISGDEGVTVRLEPGSGGSKDKVSQAGPDLGALRNIVLDGITNTNGFASVYLKPHAKDCSNITLNDISATDSAFAVHADSAEFSFDPPTGGTGPGTVPDGVIERGRFAGLRATGDIILTRTPGVTGRAIFAASDLDYIDTKNRIDGATAYEDYPLHEPSGRLRLTKLPVVPILLLSQEYADAVGPQAVRGRYSMNVSGATIRSVGVHHSFDADSDGILVRSDGRGLDGQPLSADEVRYGDATNVVP